MENDLLEELEFTEKSERDFTDSSNIQLAPDITKFANKVLLEDLLKFLPRKVLVGGRVYTIALAVSKDYCTLSYYSNIDNELIEDRELTAEEKVLNPSDNWRFYKEYLAFIILHISKLFAQINAVELNDDSEPVGNSKIIKSYDILSNLLQNEITDYEQRLNEYKNIDN